MGNIVHISVLGNSRRKKDESKVVAFNVEKNILPTPKKQLSVD